MPEIVCHITSRLTSASVEDSGTHSILNFPFGLGLAVFLPSPIVNHETFVPFSESISTTCVQLTVLHHLRFYDPFSSKPTSRQYDLTAFLQSSQS